MAGMKSYELKLYYLLTVCLALIIVTHTALALPETGEQALPEPGEQTLTLVHATMCESIENLMPNCPAVVFSISKGEIICFTNFDPVPKKTHVFHKWYKRDRLISRSKLTLNPPKWSSFSSMQLRNVDKGAWRVDITDANDTILKTLRFSISD